MRCKRQLRVKADDLGAVKSLLGPKMFSARFGKSKEHSCKAHATLRRFLAYPKLDHDKRRGLPAEPRNRNRRNGRQEECQGTLRH